jgi:hypothetical protein
MNVYQYNQRALKKNLNFGGTPAEHLATAFKNRQYHNSMHHTKQTPEVDALNFYLGNHIYAVLAGSRDLYAPLTQEERYLADTYFTMTLPMVHRAFSYLFLICMREARHVKISDGTWWPKMQAKFTPAVVQFMQKIQPMSNGVHVVSAFVSTPPEHVSIGELTEAFMFTYKNGKFSPSYGGPKWGVIAEVLHNYTVGITSAEIMLDIVWSLAHNTASIFNKGVVYEGSGGTLGSILDIQRAGQIPQLLSELQKLGPNYLSLPGSWTTQVQMSLLTAARKLYPELGSLVNWPAVGKSAIGGVAWVNYKQKQEQHYGATSVINASNGSNVFYVSSKEQYKILTRAQLAA